MHTRIVKYELENMHGCLGVVILMGFQGASPLARSKGLSCGGSMEVLLSNNASEAQHLTIEVDVVADESRLH